jgi:hypothetical protein
MSRERDYPNDAFSSAETALWFAACLSAFGGGAAGTVLVLFLSRGGLCPQVPGSVVLWGLLFLLGLLGPSVLSSLANQLLFTWPASLYAAFHAALLTCWWAERQPKRRPARWLARLAMLCFLLAGYGYFELCKATGMFVAWTFLAGFLPAFPMTLMAVREETRGRIWLAAAWALMAFSAFYWTCPALLAWKA